jgi:hypothetical protein
VTATPAEPEKRSRRARLWLVNHGASLAMILAGLAMYGLVPFAIDRESVAVAMLTLGTALLVLGLLLSRVQAGTPLKIAGVVELVLKEAIRPRVEDVAKKRRPAATTAEIEAVTKQFVDLQMRRLWAELNKATGRTAWIDATVSPPTIETRTEIYTPTIVTDDAIARRLEQLRRRRRRREEDEAASAADDE